MIKQQLSKIKNHWASFVLVVILVLGVVFTVIAAGQRLQRAAG